MKPGDILVNNKIEGKSLTLIRMPLSYTEY